MAPGWYERLANWNVESLFARAPPPATRRSVFVHQDLPGEYFTPKGKPRKEYIYTTNQVVTSKYTIITFLPRNLLEQFRRVANVFFLAIDILQFFPKFSTISPGLVILPLLIILTVTGAKDGYEDYKRHQSDHTVNYTETLILDGGGWVNPNQMGGKSKTFIKALLPKQRKNPKLGDVQKSEGHTAASEPETDHYDDDEEAEREPRSHRYSFGGRSTRASRGETSARWKRTIWEDVRVGDFIKLRNNEPIPADILICATSEEENVAFIETKNLDGETNLKSRNAVPALSSLRSARACAEDTFGGFRIDCEAPDVNMYKMNGALEMSSGSHPVDLQTVLLRGSVLRNTKWVIGIVLFTGTDTKIVLNSGATPSKRSRVERQMNPQVFINLVLLAAMAAVCGIVDAVNEQRDYPKGAPWLYDDNRSSDNPRLNGLVTFANGFITFQNIIPISLYLSIEFVRTLQAAFIYFDHEIYHEKNDQPTLARSFNLSDDLGQIEYVFSDKTGTLTQNVMVFRQCSIGGRLYTGELGREDALQIEGKTLSQPLSISDVAPTPPGTGDTLTPETTAARKVKVSSSVLTHFHDATLAADTKHSAVETDTEFSRTLNAFFAVLALCHTVLASVDPATGDIEYRAQSPDEAALVQAAADVGFVFRGRDREILRLQTPFSDKLDEYELLNLLDFTSARKRMSVVLRKLEGGNGRILLFTKGADNVIFERLHPNESEDLKATTERNLVEFANEGLRTLCLAYKVIPEDDYEDWATRYHEATVVLHDREEQVEKVSAELERDLCLLGATAIEDKLQDGVPDAIADLKRAGIKLWVLTGDKLETAIAIGYSTNLVKRDDNLIIVRGGSAEETYPVCDQMRDAIDEFFPNAGILDGVAAKGIDVPDRPSNVARKRSSARRSVSGMSDIVGENNGKRLGGFVLVIDGAGLGRALSEPFSKQLLLELATKCEAVICCRVSPLQKALVVKLVKGGLNTMTLAIGDGANDVSMIQAADVGVGIRGEEGLQAVNSSDYAISQFRFLKRLLLVHGHWSYARNGTMILNFFYKNIVCVGVLWWFQIYCSWSTQYVFEFTYLLFWNVFWTLCPVIAIGLFDRFIDDHVLMAIPELYRYGREGVWYNLKLFAIYMFEGVYQAAVIYFFIAYGYNSTSARRDGYNGYIYEFSTTMVISAVMIANVFNGLNTHAWTGWVWFAVLVGTVLVWVYTAIYSLISPGWFSTPVFGNDYFLFRSALFWFGIPITFFLALLPRFLAKAIRTQYWPTDIDILREVGRAHPEYDMRTHPMLGGRGKAGEATIVGRASVAVDSPTRASQEYPLGSLTRVSMEAAGRSVTDMSLGGVQTTHRGFGFAAEEGGVHIRRIQSNLSERRMRELDDGGGEGRRRVPLGLFPGLRRSVRRRMRSQGSRKEASTASHLLPPHS